jgi:hypothetical protein
MTRWISDELLSHLEREGRVDSAKRTAQRAIARAWNGQVDTSGLANCEIVTVTSGGVEGHAVDLTSRGAAAADGLARAYAKPAAGVESGPLTQCREGGDTRKDSRRLVTATVAPSAAPIRPLERDVLAGVLEALKHHPRVAWAHRMNVLAQKIDDRFVKAGFKGLSDIIGQMRDGRFLAVEVKRPGGQPTQAQIEFLGLVDRSGGVAFVARSVDDVMRALTPSVDAA